MDIKSIMFFREQKNYFNNFLIVLLLAVIIILALIVYSTSSALFRNFYIFSIFIGMICLMWRGVAMGKAIWAANLCLLLILNQTQWQEIFSKGFSHAVPIILIMSVAALGAKLMSLGGINIYILYGLLNILRVPVLNRIPSGVLLAVLIGPLVVVLASMLHNITSVAIMAPILLDLCGYLGINPLPFLVALIPLSNLGGALVSYGDTPALIISSQWHISPSEYMGRMIIPTITNLIVIISVCAIHSKSKRITLENIERKLFYLKKQASSAHGRDALFIGAFSVITFIVISFLWSEMSLHIAGILLLFQLLWIQLQTVRYNVRTNHENDYSTIMVIGTDALFVISGIFVLAAVLEKTVLVEMLIRLSKQWSHIPGVGESIAGISTIFLSADGAAALLSPIFHGASQSIIQGMALQRGICPGSTVFLISDSAGPLLASICERYGTPLSFRTYAKYGAMSAILIMIVNVSYQIFLE